MTTCIATLDFNGTQASLAINTSTDGCSLKRHNVYQLSITELIKGERIDNISSMISKFLYNFHLKQYSIQA